MSKTWPKVFSIAVMLALVVAMLPAFNSPAQAVSNTVVISQVYGAGGIPVQYPIEMILLSCSIEAQTLFPLQVGLSNTQVLRVLVILAATRLLCYQAQSHQDNIILSN